MNEETATFIFRNVCNESWGVLVSEGLCFNRFCKQFCNENSYLKEVAECQQFSILKRQIN